MTPERECARVADARADYHRTLLARSLVAPIQTVVSSVVPYLLRVDRKSETRTIGLFDRTASASGSDCEDVVDLMLVYRSD